MLRVKKNGLARVAKASDFADNASPERHIGDARHEQRLSRYRIGLRQLLAIDGWMMDENTLAFYERIFEVCDEKRCRRYSEGPCGEKCCPHCRGGASCTALACGTCDA